MAQASIIRWAALGVLTVVCLTLSGLAPAQAGRALNAPAFSYRVANLTQVAQLIGPTPGSVLAGTAASADSINDTTHWGICGGDLGSLIVAKSVAYIALGDNYTTCPPGTGGPAGGLGPPDWRSNALGIIPDARNFANGLHITKWYSRDGKTAAEPIPSQHNAGDCQDTEVPSCEVTAIPTYGFTSQGHLFLAYMSVHHWGAASVWSVNYSSIAMSADGGKTWTIERGKVQWGAKSNFAQVAVTPDSDGTHMLFYGIPGGRFGAVKLMRTADTWKSVLTSGSYQYFIGVDAGGRPRWSNNQTKAVTVAGAPVGELSVIYDPGLKRWLMTYLQGGNDQIEPSSDDIVIRDAPNYWGPWSAPVTLVSHARFPGLYGAFMNPQFLGQGGKEIYFVMSEWGPYSVFWMRADLEPRTSSRE